MNKDILKSYKCQLHEFVFVFICEESCFDMFININKFVTEATEKISKFL